MYKILIADHNVTLNIKPGQPDKYPERVPNIGEHLMVRWQGQVKVCEVEDVWTDMVLEQDPPFQGAVQVLVRWGRGLDPALYARRFR
jgi:hypothetical protein